MKVIFLYFIIGLLLWSGCSKAPEYPLGPVIAFKKMSKNRMLQSLGNKYRDSLSLTIDFTDGDGDIGTPENQGRRPVDAFIIDAVSGDTTDFFTLPFIASKGASKAINGEITFAVYTNCCDVPDAIRCLEISQKYPLDTLFYKVIIKDRAGNKSNPIFLPPIQLICNQ
ncbi:MAG: hypothetical protein ACOYOA_05065 [Saprospiraceae bacterium]